MMIHHSSMEGVLDFLKLGGSLITEKDQPHTPRPEVIRRLAVEICQARRANPDMRLLLGHGSGSFGHIPARQYGTRQGVHTAQDWAGFSEVWREARGLNLIVTEALVRVGLPVIVIPPSGTISARDGLITAWNIEPIRAALDAGLIPLVFGDVVFDEARGGTILSTEDLFAYLAGQLQPRRILLAGIEAGVWTDYPTREQPIASITPANIEAVRSALHGSAAPDVTGGMLEKVESMLRLVEAAEDDLEVAIFSGLEPGVVEAGLGGASPGTIIRGKDRDS